MERNGNDEIKNRARLFKMLASADGKPVSGSFIASCLGCSRQAVFKMVSSLRNEGLCIDSLRKGYALRDLGSSDIMSPTLMESLLEGNPVFHKCLCFGETESTQAALKRIAREAPDASGVVAVSDRQSAGRGRVGRTWWSGAGKDLTFSVLTRPKLRPGEVQLLNLAAGIAVSGVMRSYYNNIDAKIKWPNDVMVRDRKVCGILSEASGEPDRIYFAVTGIGINVNSAMSDFPDELRESAASLAAECGSHVCRPYLLARVLGRFAELIMTMEAAGGRDALLRVYRDSCSTLGREVRVICDGEEFRGTARDVTDQGALVVDIGGREAVFAAADVHHLRLAV